MPRAMKVPPPASMRRFGERRVRRHLVRVVDRAVAADPVRLGHGARILGSGAMIARYTRPEIGAIWTDEARFGAMRDVEVAAAEALDGPTAEDLDAIRAATFTVDAINEREKILDHDTAAFVDVLAASAGPAGRWIHYGLTSSDVVDTGLALQLQRAGGVLVPAARTAGLGAGREGARARGDAVRRPHPRRPRRADLVRAEARRLRDRDAPQRGPAGARVRPDHGGDLRRGRHLRDARPGLRGARRREARPAATRPSPRRSSRAIATRSFCPRSR